MSLTFTKLFSSITESTIWVESHATRIVWITMLAMADRKGRVWGSIPGLANRARVTVEECESALTCFQRPDKYSRTSEHEGRRIELMDGGWRLLNYGKYREVQDEESRREYQRTWDRENRHKHSDLSDSDTNRGQPTQAEAEAEKSKAKAGAFRAPLPEGFAISPEVKAWAVEHGFVEHLEAHLDYFRDYCKANRKLYVDHDAAFRNCVKADWGDVRRSAGAEKRGSDSAWLASESGVVSKGAELGVHARKGESMQDFRGRVIEASRRAA